MAVLIIFPVILQTVINLIMLSTGEQGNTRHSLLICKQIHWQDSPASLINAEQYQADTCQPL